MGKRKEMGNKAFVRLWTIILSIVLVLTVVANILASVFYDGLTVFLQGKREYKIVETGDGEQIDAQYYKSDFADIDAAIANGKALANDIVSEGVTLLKNEGAMLPLANGAKISIFGNGAKNVIYGGGGSGSVDTSKIPNITDSLRDDGGFNVNPELAAFYESRSEKRGEISMWGSSYQIGEVPVSAFPSASELQLGEYSDAAVVVFGRPGGEGGDLVTDMSVQGAGGTLDYHQLELDPTEKELLTYVESNFDKVIVLINSSEAMELGALKDDPGVDAILWVGAPADGISSIAKVLNGTFNPSGRTVDTFARDFTKDPTFVNFGGFAYDDSLAGYHFVMYEEGIYVGYRYYETRFTDDTEFWNNVAFPFGYGLSYTTFEWSLKSNSGGIDKDGEVSFTVTVKNTGNVPGKDVIQLYVTAPYTAGQVEKSQVELIGFAKTGSIAPGVSEDVTVTVPVERFASYDYNDANGNGFKGWELDPGTYVFSLRKNSHENSAIEPVEKKLSSGIRYETDTVTDTEITNLFDDVSGHIKTYMSRNDWEGTFPTAPEGSDFTADEALKAAVKWELVNNDSDVKPTTGVNNGLQLISFKDLAYDDPAWDDLLDQMTVEEMKLIIETAGYQTAGAASINKPPTMDVDGPASLNLPFSFAGTASDAWTGRTAYPMESLIAATWNTELASRMGDAVANEALFLGVSGWYAPAMNIHRSPFAGRNFEYYSEDGVLSGLIAASVVKAAEDKGLTTYIKHFALNDQETFRGNNLLTWANEQAMREIYLRPFEYAVKQGGSTAVMSSFNRIGATWAGGSSALLVDLLREEWGFRGMVLTDFFGQEGQISDQGLRNGNDLMLTPWGGPLADSSSATAVKAMREAIHNVLYSVVNSSAMNGITANTRIVYLTPDWVWGFVAADIIILLFIVCVVLLIIRRVQRVNGKVLKPIPFYQIFSVAALIIAITGLIIALIALKAANSNTGSTNSTGVGTPAANGGSSAQPAGPGSAAPGSDETAPDSTTPGGGETPTPIAEGANTYKLVVEGFEWGPSVTKAIIQLDGDVDPSSVSSDKFKVSVHTIGFMGDSDNDRPVTDAYVSDEQGNRSDTASPYVAIEMQVGAQAGMMGGEALPGSSPFSYDFMSGLNSWSLSNYTITLNSAITVGGASVDTLNIPALAYAGKIQPLVDTLNKGSNTLDGITLTYAAYEGADTIGDGFANPLIVWLHGAGEGGTDIDIPLLGADVTELMKDPIQGHFKRDSGEQGAYILAVQTPTMWMDSGAGQHQGDQDSMYTAALYDTIEKYVAANPDIDKNRIYIGGCSNGGYMTVNMLINYPDYFAAGFPICEAYMDSFLTDDKLEILKDIPLWFTQSRDDTTVAPVNYAIPTFIRLLQAGAPDVHLSFFDNVAGQDAPGVTYMGHWSWVYALSDRSIKDQDHAAILKNAAAILTECSNIAANPVAGAFGETIGPISADLFPASSVDVIDGGMFAWLNSINLPANPIPSEGTPSGSAVTASAVSPDTAAGEGVVYEAEDADLSQATPAMGGSFVEEREGVSGGKLIGYLGNPGNKIIFTVDAPADGDATLVMVGASAAFKADFTGTDDLILDPTTVAIRVNGEAIEYASVLHGGEPMFYNFEEAVIGKIPLKAGANTIEFEIVGMYAPNFDCIKVIY
jgi:beta-glucosidase